MSAVDDPAGALDDVSSIPTHLWRYAQDQDRLIRAADELRTYLSELAQSASITVHVINSRAKSLASYWDKSRRLDKHGQLKYSEPGSQIQDCIAARVIVFTTRAREDLLQILEGRLVVVEQRNPGLEKFNGYDSEHLIVTGVKDSNLSTRLPALTGYLDSYAGLEIQLRSVASHAWAEYEHDVRYKGGAYEDLSANDRRQIDQWFVEAGGMRSVMDSLFARIEERLAPTAPATPASTHSEGLSSQPTSVAPVDENGRTADLSISIDELPGSEEDSEADRELYEADQVIQPGNLPLDPTPLTSVTLGAFARTRFPGDKPNDDHEIDSLLGRLQELGFKSLEEISAALDDVDAPKVARLMDYQSRVSSVRRLDDLLLAIFEEKYIDATEDGEFADLLRLRLRRVRGNFAIYTIKSPNVGTKLLTAAGALRRLTAVVAAFADASEIEIPGVITLHRDDLKSSARTTLINTKKGDLWVATNLSRADAEEVMRQLVSKLPRNLRLQVLRAGDVLVETGSADKHSD